MAVQLAAAGQDVGLVALIDTLHPQFRRNLSPVDRMRFQLSYTANRGAKYARNLAAGRIDRIARNGFDYVWHRGKRAGWKLARSLSRRLARPMPGGDSKP